jgi:acetyl/propionyl-CoA carboxylase alpha subunit
MNTRIQVEHPITELVTGLDLVVWQLRIAAGERLDFTQADVRPRGHAIEVRLYAEDPAQTFFPSAAPVLVWRAPGGPGVRVDAGIASGSPVPVEYDPLLAKLSAWGPDRAAAIRRLRAALAETAVLGPVTNLAFLQDVIALPAFAAGDTHTGFLAEHLPAWKPSAPDLDAAAIAAALASSSGPARHGDEAAAAPATPWESLGAWRLGAIS